MNHKKTQLKISGAKKILTGVSISTGVLKAPKEFKRKLRAQVYELEMHAGQLSKMESFDPMIYERVLGRINYLLQIEPGNKYALRKKKILSTRHQEFMSLAGDYSNLFG
ncbi:hypothetical protein D9M71_815740 [compost metagenome]